VLLTLFICQVCGQLTYEPFGVLHGNQITSTSKKEEIMTTNPTCTWIGASGKNYVYHTHALPVSFEEGQLSNYIYAKTVNDKWRPIYIGQGDLGDRIGPNHHKADCIADRGTTY
jgi:hypothetical protein